MVTPEVRGELVELMDMRRKEEVLGVKIKDPRVNWGMGVRGVKWVVAVAYFEN